MEALTPSLEDYLEAIWVAGLKKRVVRVKDIVKRLSVRSASVIGALKALGERGLVVHERYGYVELTEEGSLEAESIYEKHTALAKFLNEILGMDLETALKDACRIEHHIDRRTMDRIAEFIHFIETCPEGEPVCLSGFRHFLKHGKRPSLSEKAEA